MMEYPLHTSQQLGVVELVKADLLAQCGEGHNGMQQSASCTYMC